MSSNSSRSPDDNKPAENSPERAIYPCKYCRLTFSTLQALGGHQNAHRSERQAEKKKNESMKNQSSSVGAMGDSSSVSSRRQWYEYAPLSAPMAPPQSAPVPPFWSAPPLARAPVLHDFFGPSVAASSQPILHNFFGPSDAANSAGVAAAEQVEEVEEEEEDINLDLKL